MDTGVLKIPRLQQYLGRGPARSLCDAGTPRGFPLQRGSAVFQDACRGLGRDAGVCRGEPCRALLDATPARARGASDPLAALTWGSVLCSRRGLRKRFYPRSRSTRVRRSRRGPGKDSCPCSSLPLIQLLPPERLPD
jgi:hypothetical protein